jgi:hypothetical protein
VETQTRPFARVTRQLVRGVESGDYAKYESLEFRVFVLDP